VVHAHCSYTKEKYLTLSTKYKIQPNIVKSYLNINLRTKDKYQKTRNAAAADGLRLNHNNGQLSSMPTQWQERAPHMPYTSCFLFVM